MGIPCRHVFTVHRSLGQRLPVAYIHDRWLKCTAVKVGDIRVDDSGSNEDANIDAGIVSEDDEDEAPPVDSMADANEVPVSAVAQLRAKTQMQR